MSPLDYLRMLAAVTAEAGTLAAELVLELTGAAFDALEDFAEATEALRRRLGL